MSGCSALYVPHRESHLLRTLIFFLLTLFFSLPISAGAQGIHDHEHPRVLVLHSYHAGLPWTDSVQEGLLAGLGDQVTHINLFIEYLDALRFPKTDASEVDAFASQLKNRFGSADIDILLATDDPAYNFLLAHRDRLWPGKPLIFAGVNNIRPENLEGLALVSGVAESPDFLANLRLMQKLHPALERLVLVGDTTKTFVSNLEALHKANEQLAKPFTLEPLTRRTVAEVLSAFKEIPGDYLVFLMGRPLDDRGNFLDGPSMANYLRQNTEKPIYSAWSFFLGRGIIGGKVVSGEQQGRELAGLLTRLIDKVPFAQLPRLIESPNRYVFDARELQRFNLNERALPDGSEVLNRPAQLWEAYPKTFVTIIALFVSLLIVVLLQARLMRTKRRLAQAVERELLVMETLMNAIPFPVFYKGVDLVFKRLNTAFTRFIGKPAEQLLGQPFSAVASEPLARFASAKDEDLLGTGEQQVYEAKMPASDGTEHEVVFHTALVRLADGQLDGIVGAIVDVSESRAQMARLSLYASMFEHAAAAIVVTDAENRIIVTNPAMRRMSGYDLPDLVGQNPRILAAGQTSPATYEMMWKALLEKGVWTGELVERRKDGSTYPKYTVISVVRDAAGKIINFIASYTDITQQKAAEDSLRHLAMHDSLTGLPNRSTLENYLPQVCARARRNNQCVAMLFIDLDRFKNINDTLGHHIGDAVLVKVARRIRGVLRLSDFVARLGGDEFVAVLADLDSAMDATPAAQKILSSIGEPYLLQGNLLHISPSIGVSVYPEDSEHPLDMLKHSDIAMYAAKEKGRNAVQFFTPAMNQAAQLRIALERDLRVAIKTRQFALVYQPKVASISERVVGAEALIRWPNSPHGNVPPSVFIPLVEDMGLIGTLGAWVLEEAFQQLATWNRRGGPPLNMAINLSAQQLQDEKLADFVANLLQIHALPAHQIELEITESTAMSDPTRAIEQLRRLRNVGVSLAIDDFGTGYSSLAYLKDLPIQTLKLDRSFVKNIETNGSDAAISLATLALAHSLKLKVVAEGIETEGQAVFLRENGCDLMQGYYFGRPESAENWPTHWLSSE